MNTDNKSTGTACENCNSAIRAGEEYYFINGNAYCMQCKTIARREILEEVEHSYIYEEQG